jgi:hypothetical protein
MRTVNVFRAPTAYEEEMLKAQRQQQLAEMLRQQAEAPEQEYTFQGFRAMPSLAGGLARVLKSYGARKAEERADEAARAAREADVAGAEELQRALAPQTRSITGGALPETDVTGMASAYQPEMAQQPMMETVAPTAQQRRDLLTQYAVRGTPTAQRLAQVLAAQEPKDEEFYAPTETATGLVQFGKRGGKQETGYKAPPKSETPTPLARLIAERDALPPNDPRRATYDAAIKGETQGRGTVVNIPTARDLQKDESGLRDQLEGRLKGMDWPGTQSAMQRILTAPQTPAGDVTIVYALAKANDPSGAVREDDFNKLAQSGSLGQKIQSLYEEANSGRMTPEKRKELIDTALSFYRIREQGVNKLLSDYEGIAKRSGLNIENVIAPFRPMPLWTDEQEKRLQELRKKAASAGGLK